MQSSKHILRNGRLLGIAASLFASSASAAVCPGGDSPVSCHSLAPTAVQAKGGGTPLAIAGYPPLGSLAGVITLAATNANTHASDPGLVTEVSAGAWGSAGREPIVAASIRYEVKPADGLLYLNDDTSYSFSCDPATEALCFPDGTVVKTGRATLKRRYRVVAAPGATLPAGVTSAPILVDYEIHFAHQGSHLGSEGAPIAATWAQASVKFGNYSGSGGGFIFNGKGVDCSSGNSGVLACWSATGSAPTKGTLSPIQVNIGEDTSYFLQILAAARRNDAPTCKPRVQIEGQPCLIDPWSGSARVVTDPYVYVDPSWAHAASVLVQMAEDEDATTWVVPQRTQLDFDQMKIVDTPPGGADAGTAPPGSKEPTPTGPGVAPPAEGTPAEQASAGSSAGGCALAPASSPTSGALISFAGLWLLVKCAGRRRKPNFG